MVIEYMPSRSSIARQHPLSALMLPARAVLDNSAPAHAAHMESNISPFTIRECCNALLLTAASKEHILQSDWSQPSKQADSLDPL